MAGVRRSKRRSWLRVGRMGAEPVVLEDGEVEQGVPGLGRLGEGVGLPGEAVQAVAQHAVEPLDPGGAGWGDERADRRLDLDRKQPTLPVAVLDALGQRQVIRHLLARAPHPPLPHRPPIRPGQDRAVVAPAVTAPGERSPAGAGLGLRDGGAREALVVIMAAGVRDDHPTRPILDQAAPAITDIRRVSRDALLVLLLTNDQNSSISTVDRRRSRTSASSIAVACRAASFSQRPIVSYLWPVTSSAARRLPRRITSSSARPISAGGVFSRYSGVPCVSPNHSLQPRQ